MKGYRTFVIVGMVVLTLGFVLFMFAELSLYEVLGDISSSDAQSYEKMRMWSYIFMISGAIDELTYLIFITEGFEIPFLKIENNDRNTNITESENDKNNADIGGEHIIYQNADRFCTGCGTKLGTGVFICPNCGKFVVSADN